MKPIVVRYRIYTWAGLFLLVFCTGAGALRSRHSLYYLGLFLAAVFIALGSQKDIFFEAGIESRFVVWHNLRAWEEVIQAGITKVSDQGSYGPYLLLTYAGGVPKTPGMGFRDWKQRNGGKCLYVPVDQPLRELVIRYYGPLDFDIGK